MRCCDFRQNGFFRGANRVLVLVETICAIQQHGGVLHKALIAIGMHMWRDPIHAEGAQWGM